MTYTLNVTLEELYNGTIRTLRIERYITCSVCKGTGLLDDIVKEYDNCEKCKGLGVQRSSKRSNSAMAEQINEECVLCWGKGWLVIPKQRCAHCLGRKVVRKPLFLKVEIQRGSTGGRRIFFDEEGTQEPEKEVGDVVVLVKQLNHRTFQRSGDDLVATLDLSLTESLCGFRKMIVTLDNRKIWISNTIGEVVAPNDWKIVEGEGMPKAGDPSVKGSLIIYFNVNFPTSIRSIFAPIIQRILPSQLIQEDIPFDAIEVNMVTFFKKIIIMINSNE